MFKIRSIFSRPKKRRFAASGWWRETNDFVKFNKLGDGAVASLMVGSLTKTELDAIYQETKELIEKREKAFRFLSLSFAFATIAFFGFSSSIKISGISLSVEIVPHVAMAIVCYASWSFSNVNSKLGFSATYFEHIYFSKTANERARFLLEYPLILPPFLFARTIRGFPKYVHPNRTSWWGNFTLFGMLFALLAGAMIATSVNLYGLWVIWNSNFPTPALAKIYVGLVMSLVLFVLANPAFTNIGRRYRHYGLSEAIRKLPEDRQRTYHRRINVIRLAREARNGSDDC